MRAISISTSLCVLVAASTGVVRGQTWLHDDFESYENHVDLHAAWPIARNCQDAHLFTSEKKSGVYGWHAMDLLPDDNTRHVRVFDPTNSVNGSDAHPLKLEFHLFWPYDEDLEKALHYCQLINIATGDTLAVGTHYDALQTGPDEIPGMCAGRPVTEALPTSRWFQVFNGARWLNLTDTAPRGRKWNQIQMIVKSHVIIVNVSNRYSNSEQIVPRANTGGFGALAVGSGMPGGSVRIDSIVLEGGTLSDPQVPDDGGCPPSMEELALIREIHSAGLVQEGGHDSSLKRLESILGRVEACCARDVDVAGLECGCRVLPRLYAAIARTKQNLRQGQSRIRDVYGAAIRQCPDGIGISGVVSALADLFQEPQRTRCLWNLARQYPRTGAGRAAATLLIQNVTRSPGEMACALPGKTVFTLADLMIPGEPLWRMMRRPESWPFDPLMIAPFLFLRDDPLAVPLLQATSTCLLQEGKRGPYRELCEVLARDALAEDARLSETVRELTFKWYATQGDVIGAMASMSDQPLREGKAGFIARFKALATPAEAGACLDAFVKRTEPLALFLDNTGQGMAGRRPPRVVLYEAAANVGRQLSLPLVQRVAYQRLARHLCGGSVSSVMSLPLEDDFAHETWPAESLARFWEAQSLIAGRRLARAGALLEGLPDAKDPSVRAQCLHDLARVRFLQHRLPEAAKAIEACLAIVPSSDAARTLKDAIDDAVATQERLAQTYVELGKHWQVIETTQDADQAVRSLLAVAELEGRLSAPGRAAKALEIIVNKYPTSQRKPQVLMKLARLYQNELGDPATGKRFMDLLAKEFPESAQMAVASSRPEGRVTP